VPAAQAILRGALERNNPTNPVYWIHTSGAGIFSYLDTDKGVYGKRGEKVYDDWEGITEITSLPDHALHRDVDKIVLQAGAEHSRVLKTAIISPVTVYGVSHFSSLYNRPRLKTDSSIQVEAVGLVRSEAARYTSWHL
jgi:hypothetical protein